MAGRRANGEGTLVQRVTGTWVAQATVSRLGGGTRRVTVSGRTRAEANAKLQDVLKRHRDGYAVAGKSPSVATFLDYWISEVVPHTARPSTLKDYRGHISRSLKPKIGHIELSRLTPTDVQRLVNEVHSETGAPRSVTKMRDTLRAALNYAEGQELVTRNVAKNVTLPRYNVKTVQPWSPPEVQHFLNTARDHRWYPIFLLICVYGTRRGEALGLSWNNVDFANNRIRFDQQLLRIKGPLELARVKTKAGERTLPMPPIIRNELLAIAATANHIPALTSGDGDPDLVFRTGVGTPINAERLSDSFHKLTAQAGLRRIRLHDLRHTAATLLKYLGVPDRDIQHILGHAHVSTTQQIYQHADLGLQAEGLEALSRLIAPQTAAKIAANAPSAATAESSDGDVDPRPGPPGATGGGAAVIASNPSTPARNSSVHTSLTSEVSPLPTASERQKTEQTAAKTAAKIAELLHQRESRGPVLHASCPLDHTTDWLLAELESRLESEGGGCLAA